MEPTPGPWRFEPSTRTVRTAVTNYWLATLDSWDGAVKPHNEANGHLMAAAPELLSALEKAVAVIRSLRVERGWQPDSATVQIAEAAIAKARGGA